MSKHSSGMWLLIALLTLVMTTTTNPTIAKGRGGGPWKNPAPDLTSELIFLGNPAMERYPERLEHAKARNVWDLQEKGGLIYGSEGDGNRNTGTNVTPPWIWYYDPVLGQFVLDYELYDEAGITFQVWTNTAGDIAMPGVDSLGSWGHVYHQVGATWQLYSMRSLSHMWDTEYYAGNSWEALLMAGTTNGSNSPVRVSLDGGDTWESSTIPVGEQAYAFIQIDGQLYVQSESKNLGFYRYLGGVHFQKVKTTLGRKGSRWYLDSRVRYVGNRAVYMWKRTAATFASGGIYAASTLDDAGLVFKPPRGYHLVDFTIASGGSGETQVYATLAADWDDDLQVYPQAIFRSDQTLSDWQPIAAIVGPNILLSIEVADGNVYLGESEWGGDTYERSGNVWQLPAELIGN